MVRQLFATKQNRLCYCTQAFVQRAANINDEKYWIAKMYIAPPSTAIVGLCKNNGTVLINQFKK